MKFLNFLRREPLNKPKYVLSSLFVFAMYGAFLYPNTPAWVVSMLYTIMWFHIVIMVFATIILMSILHLLREDTKSDLREIEKMAFSPRILATTSLIFAAAVMYKVGFVIAGGIFLINLIFFELFRDGIRRKMNDLVIKRLMSE